MDKHCIIMPCYNDWQSAVILIEHIEKVVAQWNSEITIVIVNDGSQEDMPAPETLTNGCSHIKELLVIDLVCNQGHQRAIAVGLAYARDRQCFTSVFVMDSDGEDPPNELNDLHDAGLKHNHAIITANRVSRSEVPLFQCWYVCYKWLFFLLTGTNIQFGNFCRIPALLLDKLVYYPELWNNLSGCIKKSGLPIVGTPSHRGMRYIGPSKMNFISLILHGLGAISVFKEALMVRLIILTSSFSISTGILCFLSLTVSIGELNLAAIHATMIFTGLFVLSVLILVILALALFTQLHDRSRHVQGPLFFWKDYVKNINPLI